MNDVEKQIEKLKKELALFLKIAKELKFPQKEVDKQVNLYLDNINDLKKKK